ncbi:aminopeptidase [Candidatus Riflebacteria bacterium]
MKDFKKIAKILVERQLRIKEKEVVSVSGGLHNLDFLEEITIAVRRVGGFPMLHLGWENLAKRLVNDIPEKFLSQVPDHSIVIEELIDCHISIPSFADPGKLEQLHPKKILLKTKAGKAVHEASVKKGARRIGIGYPTEAEAKIYGVPFPAYHDLFWTAVDADLDRIFELCHKIREKLRGDRVRIISPQGDELRFSIKDRRINMDDGVMSDEDFQSGDLTANLPFGEVYVAPIEETVAGVAAYPLVFHKGKKIKNLKLIFKNGKMVDSQAAENHELFLEAIATHTGDKDKIGEMGIGTNHEVHEPMGNTLLDEKIFGSIHLALGENRSYGGKNISSCHWDMVMLSPTLYIDDVLLLENGKFVL